MEINDNNGVNHRNELKTRNTEKAIYFNFSYAALKLLGKNLYSNAANAISELVANSIDAKASKVYVYIDMSEKEHSTIEILDDGSGMSYSDLAEKYVWIGRNKRNDYDLSDKDRKTVMGRKGIGKLAALYLSNQYYIITRKAGETQDNQWEVNLSQYNESDYPKLDRIYTPVSLDCEKEWKSFPQGTIIKLNNVDLRQNGEKRIESLRRVFADFYLLDAIGTKILVAVKTSENETVQFMPVEKRIAYKNFYALFDNSGLDIASKMSKSISFSWASRYEHIANKERDTIILDIGQYNTRGKGLFQKEDGTYIEKDYSLIGWIAIHSTIEQKNAVDANFLRNNIYQPNRLRLYVRNKIAVEDYFTIKPNTQTMANYIEGEISFDILDDDDLPDIATSSRQDFLDDKRIELLISIVERILGTLFSLRNRIGKTISDENEQYEDDLLRQEEEKRRAEEDARKKAEDAQIKAEEKYIKAQRETDKYHAQSNIIFSTVTEDQKSFSAKTHLVKTNALTIRNGVKTLAKKIGIEKYKELSSISIAADKILSVLKYSAIAKFNIEDEFIVEDLFAFCDEYLLNVLGAQYFNIELNTKRIGEYSVRFNPQYITLLLDNIMSNAGKSNSSKVDVDMYHDDLHTTITIKDNGDGFKDVDMRRIFDFGFSNTGGTGIGLYNVKTVVERMGGRIEAEANSTGGAKFTIILQ